VDLNINGAFPAVTFDEKGKSYYCLEWNRLIERSYYNIWEE